MAGLHCERCGSGALARTYIGFSCPICGECVYDSSAGRDEMWAEHRLGLMYRRGGWLWMAEIDPPSWFIEEVA